VTQGLLERFGAERIIDTPISESAILGVAIGAAMTGIRPVAEIMFAEFLTTCMEMMVNQAAIAHYMTNGKIKMPIVIRAAYGIGPHGNHLQNFEAWFAHVPGIKVVIPSHPSDAKYLLKASIRDDNPVLFLESSELIGDAYNGADGKTEEVESSLDKGELEKLGKARLLKDGSDITLISYGYTVWTCLAAATELEKLNISAQVLDLRTVKPFDQDSIIENVRSTGRCVIVHEAWRSFGVGAEISSFVHEECFDVLKAPVLRIGAEDVPIPANPVLQKYALPDSETIVQACKEILQNSIKRSNYEIQG
jgi:pyruvate dehydrogenase E1 component beta subunit